MFSSPLFLKLSWNSESKALDSFSSAIYCRIIAVIFNYRKEMNLVNLSQVAESLNLVLYFISSKVAVLLTIVVLLLEGKQVTSEMVRTNNQALRLTNTKEYIIRCFILALRHYLSL